MQSYSAVSQIFMQCCMTLEIKSLLDLLWNLADAWLADVFITDGISQFLLTCVMTLCLSTFLCVHFEKLASIKINQKGVKGDFYSKLKNRFPELVVLFGAFAAAPTLPL